jgi:hypothetical protein
MPEAKREGFLGYLALVADACKAAAERSPRRAG